MENSFLYLLESLKYKSRYLGSTNCPGRRIKEHNSRKVEATKLKAPWRCVFVINVGDLNTAREIEMYIKKNKEALSIENIVKILNRYYRKKGAISSVG